MGLAKRKQTVFIRLFFCRFWFVCNRKQLIERCAPFIVVAVCAVFIQRMVCNNNKLLFIPICLNFVFGLFFFWFWWPPFCFVLLGLGRLGASACREMNLVYHHGFNAKTIQIYSHSLHFIRLAAMDRRRMLTETYRRGRFELCNR